MRRGHDPEPSTWAQHTHTGPRKREAERDLTQSKGTWAWRQSPRGLGARSSPSPLRCPPPTPQHAAQPRKTAVDTPVREAAGLTGRQASRPPSAGAGREGVRWGPEAVGTGRERLGLPRVRDLACRPELLWAPRRVGQTCRPQPGPDTSREMGLAGCTLKATQGARGATRACPPHHAPHSRPPHPLPHPTPSPVKVFFS